MREPQRLKFWLRLIAIAVGVLGLAVVGVYYVVRSVARYDVRVENASDATWRGLRLRGGGVDESIGDLAPGAATEVAVWFDRDGSLVIEESGPTPGAEHLVEGYVTNGLGGNAVVVRQKDGAVSVTMRSR